MIHYTGLGLHLMNFDVLDLGLNILITVAVMNSINMLDNMDGIATNVSLFILLYCGTVVFWLCISELLAHLTF